MKHTQEFSESQSPDPVIREMARMAHRILSDMVLTKPERADLIHRLEAEYRAYKAWNRQYASYFRTSRSRSTTSNQASNGSHKNGRI